MRSCCRMPADCWQVRWTCLLLHLVGWWNSDAHSHSASSSNSIWPFSRSWASNRMALWVLLGKAGWGRVSCICCLRVERVEIQADWLLRTMRKGLTGKIIFFNILWQSNLCEPIPPTYISATELFHKDPIASTQLFQVSRCYLGFSLAQAVLLVLFLPWVLIVHELL